MGFFALNTRLSRLAESLVPIESDKPIWQAFLQRTVEAASAAPPGSRLVDVGGGRRCVWASAVGDSVRIVAVDIDPAELAMNVDVHEKIVADVAHALPLPPDSAQLIVSRAVLEHVEGVPAALALMSSALAPGGRMLHLVPCRNSAFAITARIGPFAALRRLVHLAIPGTEGQVEFPAYYDHCTPREIEALLRTLGFEAVSIDVSWSQTGYFVPVFPLFTIVAAYQTLVRRLGMRELCSYMLVDATK